MCNQSVFEGDIFTTQHGCKALVVTYRNACKVLIEFQDAHKHRLWTRAAHLREGSVKNPYHPRIYGVGYIGVGQYSATAGGKMTEAYSRWKAMLERCYCHKQQARNPCYIGCTVHPSWHNFQVFAEWFYVNHKPCHQLDKDKLHPGNKVYGPDYCCFIPQQENAELANSKSFKLISPDGGKVDVFNLSKFARENALNKSNLWKLVTGKRKSHKGWKAA